MLCNKIAEHFAFGSTLINFDTTPFKKYLYLFTNTQINENNFTTHFLIIRFSCKCTT
jgi:hypothetical protein